MQKYKLRTLIDFEKDLDGVLEYITFELGNPNAALELIEELDKAVYKRLDMPLSFERYYSKKERADPYYRIRVKNYVVYYVVIGDVVELRRFLYNRRNVDEMI